MHKSKNYDMATQVAMDKLMPKPIQITISMQGGGGLRGLGERPVSSVYGRPIPRTVYRQGGGISNINKSININGQPHKLAWIRPDEASALKAMGGSGKKVEGIPAYFYDFYGEEGTGGGDPAISETSHSFASDTYTAPTYTDPTQDPGVGRGRGFEDENVYTTTTTDQTSDDTMDYTGADIVAGGDKQRLRKEIARDDEGPTDIRKGILGLYGDTMTRGEALEGAKRSAFTTWRNTVGKYSLDAPKDYEEWFAAQDPNALIAGYKIGDPVGMAMQSSFDNVNKQLKKKFEERASQKSEYTDEELTREELGEIVESAKVEGLEDFTPYSGLDYPIWMPGGTAIKAMDFFSRTVIGTGTVGGVGVHLHKDGSVTPISPEDSPGFDHEAMKGENVEPVRRRSPAPRSQAAPPAPEPDAPKKGTMAELLSRQGPTDRLAGIRNLEDILARTHPGKDFNIG